ncbi:Histidine kinase-like ATPase domain-containing protein [Streptomyces sp. ScaeMP-6W]|nr:Histidine kinase-like ATPase domain-containing protein [Streptomyces sp. BvitLS-983]SCD94768.1 Histidine kinase-like ATPase domain-containing protein [Streptomyces sp. IgraMP-1]SCE22988.1 Histidine kinase-like ATPase domain-containing protein [Streptomyces sp. ScaeMP-6W]
MADVTPPAPLAPAVLPPQGATAERCCSFDVAAHPRSASEARRLTRERLAGWPVCPDTREAADLVVSELVTNAIVHTTSRRITCELRSLREGECLRIAVRDEGHAGSGPRPAEGRPAEEHGRGLLLVAALASAWGALEAETGTGLTVWAELPARPSHDLGSGA